VRRSFCSALNMPDPFLQGVRSKPYRIERDECQPF
jgi:hypothetical protein